MHVMTAFDGPACATKDHDDDHLNVSELLVAVAAEMGSIAEDIEDLGCLFSQNAGAAPEMMTRLQSIDRNARVLTNLARLLEHVSRTVPEGTQLSDASLRETMLLSELYRKLSPKTASGPDVSASDDCDFF